MAIALPDEWQISTFEDSLTRITNRANSIPTADYQEVGNIPIVDQGKDLFAGYVDDESLQYSCPPEGLIVFGDHTRIVKFIDRNFVLGADGTQLLEPHNGFHPKYLYYLLTSKEIPNTGYNRHFKFLKDMNFAKPKMSEQIAIANALSDIDELIENLRNEILKLELVFEAQKDFYFSKENTKKWEAFKIAEIGVLSTATRKQSNFESSSGFVILDMGSVSDKGLILETKYTRESLDLLSVGDLVIPKDDIGGGNIIGKAVHVPTANRYVLGDHVFKLSVDKKVFSPEFTRYILNSKESNKRVISLVAGSAQLGLPKSSFLTHQLSFPNLETQNSICEKLYATEVSLYSSKQNLNKYECIKQGMAHDLLTGKVRLV